MFILFIKKPSFSLKNISQIYPNQETFEELLKYFQLKQIMLETRNHRLKVLALCFEKGIKKPP